jgi:Fur family ferric uptake transcriptional regulator
VVNYKLWLKDKGIKVTAHKLAVLETLINHRHIDANNIFETLRNQHSEISLATIYRILAIFESEGIVDKLNFSNGQAVYELSYPESEHHDHLICIECGKIQEFHNQAIEELQLKIAKEKNFKVTTHSLNIYGVCSCCEIKHS